MGKGEKGFTPTLESEDSIPFLIEFDIDLELTTGPKHWSKQSHNKTDTTPESGTDFFQNQKQNGIPHVESEQKPSKYQLFS